MESLKTLLANYQILGNPDVDNIRVVYYGIMPKPELDKDKVKMMLDVVKQFCKFCVVKILIADIHSYLMYKYDISVDIWTKKLRDFIETEMQGYEYEVIMGSSFQNSHAYNLDLLKISTKVDIDQIRNHLEQYHECKTVGDLIYPLMQILDESALEADLEISDNTQIDIFNLKLYGLVDMGLRECCYLIV